MQSDVGVKIVVETLVSVHSNDDSLQFDTFRLQTMTLTPKLVQPKRLLALLASVTCASVLLAACVEEPPPVTPTEPLNIVINEIESSGGVPGDWVELYNAGTQTADISGLYFKDDNDNRTYQIPAGTTIAPSEFYVLEEADFDFGLGGADQARLFDTDGVTLLDSYTWKSHATTTYGRCPDGVGEFQDTNFYGTGAAKDQPIGLRMFLGIDLAISVAPAT